MSVVALLGTSASLPAYPSSQYVNRIFFLLVIYFFLSSTLNFYYHFYYTFLLQSALVQYKFMITLHRLKQLIISSLSQHLPVLIARFIVWTKSPDLVYPCRQRSFSPRSLMHTGNSTVLSIAYLLKRWSFRLLWMAVLCLVYI